MTKHYPVIIEQDKDGVYIVECPVLKSCRSYGRTISEAMENIQEAIGVCLLEEPPMAMNADSAGTPLKKLPSGFKWIRSFDFFY
jgi:predicted RNase H-like HicB family nuclease